jgi:biotin synthase
MLKFTLADIINAPLKDLLDESDKTRSATFGNDIDLCAIVNIKNGRCPMDCRFCAQSQHHNATIETYPLLRAEELSQETHKLWEQNIPRVGWVASGCSPTPKEIDEIVNSATTLANFAPSLRSLRLNFTAKGAEDTQRVQRGEKQLCASLGQLGTPSLKKLKAAGFCRYHHNLETSERFYPSICTTQQWRDRRTTVERVKELGWSVCSGGLFGLGETWEDRRQLALTLKELEVDSVPINLFMPISGTPLADREVLSIDEALRIVVLFRLTLPAATIRICGGRPGIFGQQGELLFRAGANALMTGDYLTTSGISPESDREMIKRSGLQG